MGPREYAPGERNIFCVSKGCQKTKTHYLVKGSRSLDEAISKCARCGRRVFITLQLSEIEELDTA